MKPRKLEGWSHISGSVYEHKTGLRIHLLGIAKMPNGTVVDWQRWDQFKGMMSALKIQGHNHRRAMMHWAIRLSTPKQ